MLMNVNLSSRLWPAVMGLAGVALHRRAVVSLPGLSHSFSVTCDSGAVLGATSAGRGQDWRAAEVTAGPRAESTSLQGQCGAFGRCAGGRPGQLCGARCVKGFWRRFTEDVVSPNARGAYFRNPGLCLGSFLVGTGCSGSSQASLLPPLGLLINS